MRKFNFGDTYRKTEDKSIWMLVSSKIGKDYSKLYYVTGKMDTVNKLCIHRFRKLFFRTRKVKNENIRSDYKLIKELKNVE